MNEAMRRLRAINPNGLLGVEDGYVVMIEDCSDPDGRIYRMEYRATPDGQHATAWCIYNPWSTDGSRNAGEDYRRGHVAEDGFLCVGSGADRNLASSPSDIEHATSRARYWATAFSWLKERGEFPNP